MQPKGPIGTAHFHTAIRHKRAKVQLRARGGNRWQAGMLMWWAEVQLPDGSVRKLGGLIQDLAGRNEAVAIEADLAAKVQALEW